MSWKGIQRQLGGINKLKTNRVSKGDTIDIKVLITVLVNLALNLLGKPNTNYSLPHITVRFSIRQTHLRRNSTMRQVPHYINGKCVEGTSGLFGDIYNPSTGEVQAQVQLATH
mgnify:CR=1 FL=1